VLVADFGAQKDVVQTFGAPMQSTLIAFRGKAEIGRSIGETNPAAIKAMLLGGSPSAEMLPAQANLLLGGTYLLAALAGVLSILSPCVLPLLPIVMADAMAAHRFGAVALAAGIAVSFAAAGLLLATIGLSIGLRSDTLRMMAAALMIPLGLVLASERLQAWFALTLERPSARAPLLIACAST